MMNNLEKLREKYVHSYDYVQVDSKMPEVVRYLMTLPKTTRETLLTLELENGGLFLILDGQQPIGQQFHNMRSISMGDLRELLFPQIERTDDYVPAIHHLYLRDFKTQSVAWRDQWRKYDIADKQVAGLHKKIRQKYRELHRADSQTISVATPKEMAQFLNELEGA